MLKIVIRLTLMLNICVVGTVLRLAPTPNIKYMKISENHVKFSLKTRSGRRTENMTGNSSGIVFIHQS
jgi:hypothetical protein